MLLSRLTRRTTRYNDRRLVHRGRGQASSRSVGPQRSAVCGAPQGNASACPHWLGRRERQWTPPPSAISQTKALQAKRMLEEAEEEKRSLQLETAEPGCWVREIDGDGDAYFWHMRSRRRFWTLPDGATVLRTQGKRKKRRKKRRLPRTSSFARVARTRKAGVPVVSLETVGTVRHSGPSFKPCTQACFVSKQPAVRGLLFDGCWHNADLAGPSVGAGLARWTSTRAICVRARGCTGSLVYNTFGKCHVDINTSESACNMSLWDNARLNMCLHCATEWLHPVTEQHLFQLSRDSGPQGGDVVPLGNPSNCRESTKKKPSETGIGLSRFSRPHRFFVWHMCSTPVPPSHALEEVRNEVHETSRKP